METFPLWGNVWGCPAVMDDDDAAVVKGLQKLYRLAAPKLTAAANDPWKPVVAKLQLALKSRGAEVK